MDYKSRYDIFICGGSYHADGLRTLLPRLYPFGRVHLGSITLTESELHELRPYYDVLHTPRHHPDGYLNFNLFCIRDINRLAGGDYFIKLDADILIGDDWIDYVDQAVEAYPEVVLFGPLQGKNTISIDLSDPRLRRKLGRDIQVVEGTKVIGGFYVGQTAFFRQYDYVMQTIHGLLYRFDPTLRFEPDVYHRKRRRAKDPPEEIPETFKGECIYDLQKFGDEDTMRCITVHAMQASDRIEVLDSAGRIKIFPNGRD